MRSNVSEVDDPPRVPVLRHPAGAGETDVVTPVHSGSRMRSRSGLAAVQPVGRGSRSGATSSAPLSRDSHEAVGCVPAAEEPVADLVCGDAPQRAPEQRLPHERGQVADLATAVNHRRDVVRDARQRDVHVAGGTAALREEHPAECAMAVTARMRGAGRRGREVPAQHHEDATTRESGFQIIRIEPDDVDSGGVPDVPDFVFRDGHRRGAGAGFVDQHGIERRAIGEAVVGRRSDLPRRGGAEAAEG